MLTRRTDKTTTSHTTTPIQIIHQITNQHQCLNHQPNHIHRPILHPISPQTRQLTNQRSQHRPRLNQHHAIQSSRAHKNTIRPKPSQRITSPRTSQPNNQHTFSSTPAKSTLPPHHRIRSTLKLLISLTRTQKTYHRKKTRKTPTNQPSHNQHNLIQ